VKVNFTVRLLVYEQCSATHSGKGIQPVSAARNWLWVVAPFMLPVQRYCYNFMTYGMLS